jgi:hypothetical protein
MAEPVTPTSPAPSPNRRSFSPAESAVLLRLAESDFRSDLVRASLEAPQRQTAIIPAETYSGQDMETLGGDARGGSVNLVI